MSNPNRLRVLSFVEALQAGRQGLWRAILHYDPKRGLAFSTYAWPCILRQIWRAAQAQARFEFSGVTDWAVVPRPVVDPVAEQEARLVRLASSQLVERLPARLRTVMGDGRPVWTGRSPRCHLRRGWRVAGPDQATHLPTAH